MEDYDAKTNTYTLRGGATKDFYLNGKLVQVASDQYAVPVAADEKCRLYSQVIKLAMTYY